MHRFAYLVLLGACGGHYRTELVGQGALGGSVQLAGAGYDLALDLESPRAQLVDWSVRCANAEVAHGRVGETFDAYRARRIAELKKERADDKAAAGAVTSLIVGAVAPQAKVGNARVGVDPDAAGAVVAASIDDRVELPPGDVGAARWSVRVPLQAAGACSVVATADDPAVRGQFRITRVHDLDQEAHAAAVVAGEAAVQVRGQLSDGLVAIGADPGLRARLAAEAEAKRRAAQLAIEAERARRYQAELAVRMTAEAERARVRAIADAELEMKRRALQLVVEQQRTFAVEIRGRIYGELILWGADAGLRARRQAALEVRLAAEREAADARWRAQQAIEDERARRLAEAEALQLRIAIDIRGRLRGYLVGMGAVARERTLPSSAAEGQRGSIDRPPMPALVVEAHAVAPFDGAVWIAGTWTWSGAAWLWTKGGWSDPGHFGDAGTATVVVAPPPPPVAIVVEAPPPPVVIVPSVVIELPAPRRRHVVVKPKKDPVVREHRK